MWLTYCNIKQRKRSKETKKKKRKKKNDRENLGLVRRSRTDRYANSIDVKLDWFDWIGSLIWSVRASTIIATRAIMKNCAKCSTSGRKMTSDPSSSVWNPLWALRAPPAPVSTQNRPITKYVSINLWCRSRDLCRHVLPHNFTWPC